MVRILEDLAGDWRRLDERIENLSNEIEAIARQDAGCERLISVPGIGPIISSRHGLKCWIEAARKRLHRNVLAIALANKLARTAWSVLAHGRSFEASKFDGEIA
jgi:transposase